MNALRTLTITLALACAAPAQFADDVVNEAVALATFPAAEAERYLKDVGERDPEHRVRILRAGLAHRDEAVARACALHVRWAELDERECARVVMLLRDRFAADGTSVDFEEFRSILGSDELSWIYENPAPEPWDSDLAQQLSALHRQARAAHIPLLLRLTRHPHPRVRREAWCTLMTITPRTDRHRTAIASAYFAIDVPWASLRHTEPGPATLRPTPSVPGGGLDPNLRAVLQRAVTRENLEADWLFRWLLTARPRPADAPVLIALAKGSIESRGTIAAVRAMRHLDDEASRELLAQLAQTTGELSVLAAGSLAHRGDDAMRERLLRAAPRDPCAVALLLEIDADKARALVADRVLRSDARTAARWLEALGDPEGGGAFAIDCDVDFAPLHDVAMASSLDGTTLARAAITLRGLNTRALAREAARRLRTGDLPTLPETGPLGFIEIGAPDAFRAVLDRMHASDNTDVMRLAAVLSGPCYPEKPAWPRGVLRTLLGDPLPDPLPAPAEIERRFTAYLQTTPSDVPYDLWRIDRPAVRTFLQRVRDRRSLGLYAEATAQLASMGDDAARAESLRALRAGRYRWVDTVFADAHVAIFGDDIKGMIPFWLDELESNCCRAVIARGVFEKLFGLDPHVLGDTGGETESTRMRRWWAAHEHDEFRFSRIANRWIPISRTR